MKVTWTPPKGDTFFDIQPKYRMYSKDGRLVAIVPQEHLQDYLVRSQNVLRTN